ncbi:hypothetical protein JHK82_018229 [Glycine max]|nr:hypothetical protein JHK85_018656 [Glycine max]KAG5142534.1 hypothetical protein JHK82_018229 [Glycine max]
MASKPGILTDWPWKPLGSFKYVILAPSVVHSLYSMLAKDKSERDITNFLILPFLLWRMLHNQIWITLSRHRTAKGNGRIVDKGIEFDQVDRERNWDDQILLTGLTYYLSNYIFAGASRIPLWRTDAAVVTILLHMGPVEFLYYWLHRALHHHFLYSRYHSHHHSSIVTEPITYKASDQLHDSASKREEEIPDVVHLTHLTTPESIYHLRLGFAYLACKPCTSKWYLCLMWPMTAWSMILTLAYGRTFIVEGNHFDKLKLQSWAIPKYSQQYFIRSQKMPINKMIEEAILDADKKGIKVLSLGLLNQGEDLNSYGGFYVSKHPNLKVKVIDGSSLATAIVLNSIPNGTTQVLLRGKLTKVAYTIAFTLCQQGVQVATMHKDDYVKLKNSFSSFGKNLIIEKSYTQKVMSAWRIAGIVHCLEGWSEHECNYTMHNIDKV